MARNFMKYQILISLLLRALLSANGQTNVVPPTSEFTVKGFVKNELTLKINDLEANRRGENVDRPTGGAIFRAI